MLSGTPLAASRLLRGRTGGRDETPPSKVFIFGNFDGVGVVFGRGKLGGVMRQVKSLFLVQMMMI